MRKFSGWLIANLSASRRSLLDDYQVYTALNLFCGVHNLPAQKFSSCHRVLCSLQEPVKEVFEIVGFFSILSILGSKDEALKSFR